jgi:DNA-binding MarR family transcriptional regulator
MQSLRICRTIPNGRTIRGNRTTVTTRSSNLSAADRAALEGQVIARYDEMMAAIAAGHAPEFATLDVTMAQMKALYLVAARGQLHISALADLLGVTLSTGSGLVDRLVDHGLLERRQLEHDRRHVLVSLSPAGTALLERMRELGSGRVRSMLGEIDDLDLAALERILRSFTRQAAAGSSPPTPTGVSASSAPTPPNQEGTR